MFNLAEAWGLRKEGANPCRLLEKYKEHKRERRLTEEEFRRSGQVLSEIEGSETLSAVTAIRLLSRCRLGEIQTFRWESVDLEAGELRLLDGKTGAQMVSLSGTAAGVPAVLPRDPDNPWVTLAGSRTPILQRPLAAHARQARRRTHSRFAAQLRLASAGAGREPADDREAARSCAGPDHGAIRASGAGLGEGIRFQDCRQHRRGYSGA